MTSDRLAILQVSAAAQGGGAERIARSLYEGLKRRDQAAWMAVADRNTEDPGILAIPAEPPNGLGARTLTRAADALEPLVGRAPGAGRIRRALLAARSPRRVLDRWRGREYFEYPGTAAIPDLPPVRPDVIHCHNLHGGYFDLRRLESLSRSVPVVLTLHDEWLLTGHCAFTMGCERWRTGCGSCPDLTIYPAVRRDGTAANWRAKRRIYARSRLFVSTPSAWLMDRARGSILAGGAAGWRVIPNGVDRSVFRSADRGAARELLGLPREPLILLFTANAARRNMFKDYPTVSGAARQAARALPGRRLLLIALGDSGPTERFDDAELWFVPYEADPLRVAAYYQAADLYLHAARAENLPTTIIEAMSCGLPVVATVVGGIGEQVRSLAGAPGGGQGEVHPVERATGVLVAPGDAAGMGAAAAAVLGDDLLRAALSANAAADAAERFDLDRQVDETLAWYREILADWPA